MMSECIHVFSTNETTLRPRYFTLGRTRPVRVQRERLKFNFFFVPISSILPGYIYTACF